MKQRKIKFFLILSWVSGALTAGVPETLGEFSHTLTGLLSGQTSAIVRSSSTLGQGEQEFLENRRPIVRQALSHFMQRELAADEVPTIAICGSGGGYRAMLATAGSLLSAERHGLLGASTYLAGVSGSTWLFGPWYASGLPLEQHLEKLVTSISQDMFSKKIDYSLVGKRLLKKFMFGQRISLIDLYGATLANPLLGDLGGERFDCTLSSAQARLLDGGWPMPIPTAVEGAKPYDWYEFTPFEVGTQESGSYIPTWALGRAFDGGASHDYAPEPSLGYLLGVFGAVMCASLDEVYHYYSDKIAASGISHILEELVAGPGAGHERLFEARIANFAYGMPYNFSAFKEELTFCDAGVSSNLPIPALLGPRRSIDVMIVCDSSGKMGTVKELERTMAFARRKGYAMPTIDTQASTDAHVQVYDDNPDAPIIVYLPYIKNDEFDEYFDPQMLSLSGFCQSHNTEYTQTEAAKVVGLARHNFEESIGAIRSALETAIERKQAQRKSQ